MQCLIIKHIVEDIRSLTLFLKKMAKIVLCPLLLKRRLLLLFWCVSVLCFCVIFLFFWSFFLVLCHFFVFCVSVFGFVSFCFLGFFMGFDNKSLLIVGLVVGGLLSLYLGQSELACTIFGGLIGYLSKDQITLKKDEEEV